jgi:hypothetical protein
MAGRPIDADPGQASHVGEQEKRCNSRQARLFDASTSQAREEGRRDHASKDTQAGRQARSGQARQECKQAR